MYEVYAYWNVHQLVAIFNGIVAVMGNNDFVGLVRAIAVVGLIVAAFVSLVRMRGEEIGTWFVFIAVFYVGLLVPKVTVPWSIGPPPIRPRSWRTCRWGWRSLPPRQATSETG